jgi:UDP-glucose-4-epimerase GalE
MRLLVTGGAGYVGGFTTRMLTRKGHDVTVLDNLEAGRRTAVGAAQFIEADLADPQAVSAAVRHVQPDAVLHFAALKSVADSWRQPERYRAVNVGGTLALLNAMRDAGVPALVYSGSCSIYGLPARLPVDETQPAGPLNPYGQTKWEAEQALAGASREWGLRYCSLRYFNAAGAELDGSFGEPLEKSSNLVPVVMKAALGLTARVPVFGTDYDTPDGTAIRDYVHVLDLADAHDSALAFLTNGGQSTAINVGTGVGHSVLEVVRAVERAIGRPIPIHDEGRRPGDAPRIWADVRRSEQLLGWRATHGLEAIIDSAWQWHSKEARGGH